MSPVDRVGSVSEISPRRSFLYQTFDVFLMCSYEKAGWPGYRDLGNRAGNFSHMNTPARIPGLSGTKPFQLRMACKVANKSEQGSTGILGPFGYFSSR